MFALAAVGLLGILVLYKWMISLPSRERALRRICASKLTLPPDADDCIICRDVCTSPVRLACGHHFCKECILTWLNRDHNFCPLCFRVLFRASSESAAVPLLALPVIALLSALIHAMVARRAFLAVPTTLSLIHI